MIRCHTPCTFLSRFVSSLFACLLLFSCTKADSSDPFTSTLPSDGHVRFRMVFQLSGIPSQWLSSDSSSDPPLVSSFLTHVSDELLLSMAEAQQDLGVGDTGKPITTSVFTRLPFYAQPTLTADGTRVTVYAEIDDIAEIEFEALPVYVSMRKQRSDPDSAIRQSALLTTSSMVSFGQLCNVTGTLDFVSQCGPDPAHPVQDADFLHSCYCGMCVLLGEGLIFAILFHKSRLLTPDPGIVRKMNDASLRRRQLIEKQRQAKDQLMGLSPIVPNLPVSKVGQGPPISIGGVFVDPAAMIGDRSGTDEPMNAETPVARQGGHTPIARTGWANTPTRNDNASGNGATMQTRASPTLRSPVGGGSTPPEDDVVLVMMSPAASPSHQGSFTPFSPLSKHAVYPPGGSPTSKLPLATVREQDSPALQARSLVELIDDDSQLSRPSLRITTPPNNNGPQGIINSPATIFAANSTIARGTIQPASRPSTVGTINHTPIPSPPTPTHAVWKQHHQQQQEQQPPNTPQQDTPLRTHSVTRIVSASPARLVGRSPSVVRSSSPEPLLAGSIPSDPPGGVSPPPPSSVSNSTRVLPRPIQVIHAPVDEAIVDGDEDEEDEDFSEEFLEDDDSPIRNYPPTNLPNTYTNLPTFEQAIATSTLYTPQTPPTPQPFL